MLAKIKSSSGESIAETLVAVLISAFALLMLAGTINTASNLITNSQKKLGEYYSENNALVKRESSSNSVSATVRAGTDVVDTWTDIPYYEVESSIGSKKLMAYGEGAPSSSGGEGE